MAYPASDTTRWLIGGGSFVLIFGSFGYISARPDSVVAGLSVGALTAALTLGAWWLWKREAGRKPVSSAEFFAALWLCAYLAVLIIPSSTRRVNFADAFYLMPPVSVLPLVARMVLGDDGNPRGVARTTAYVLHRVFGWLLTLIAAVFVISLFFLFVAPLPLVPGVLHLRAAHVYRTERRAQLSSEVHPPTD